MAKGFDEEETLQHEEKFVIAFENCETEKIKKFKVFLEKYKLLSFKNEPEERSINDRLIKFVEIHFLSDFLAKSEYIDRLKFQLKVAREEDDSVDGIPSSKRSDTQNSWLSWFEPIRRLIQDAAESEEDRELFTKDLEMFELRRNNIDSFSKKDLESYLVRGTILHAIFNDGLENEIQSFLEDRRFQALNSQDDIDKIFSDEKYKMISNYIAKITRMLSERCQNVTADFEKTGEFLQNIVTTELDDYSNYNYVREKLTVIPLHKDLNPDHPLKKWISLRYCLGRQPLTEIKNYFGVKVATYFAWAGFYTFMLIIASALGLLSFIFGLIFVPYSKLSADICESNITMCPRCDKVCDYWKLKDTCIYSILHHAIDNYVTVAYTIFMSLWSALYLRQWQRYIAQYNTVWDVINLDPSVQFSRKEYVRDVRKLLSSRYYSSENVDPQDQRNSLTKVITYETNLYYKVPKRERIWRISLSFFICLLWVILALGMVFALLLYRMSLITSEKLYGDRNSNSIYFVPISTALLDLIGIQILNYIYGIIAVYLNDMELQRTEIEYENSLSIKLFMFQFVNYYSVIFYIAVLKGKFIGNPSKYNRVFGLRQEECNPGGCLVEMALQLSIIMIGRQAIKLATPYILKQYSRIKEKYFNNENNCHEIQMKNKLNSSSMHEDLFVKNYSLKSFNSMTLMPEYLEMVIQFGFVTLFVAAFPLAPLFALLNNILEVRLDGRKFLKDYRRPLPCRVKGIGVWLNIMAIITRIATASNAVIIAFSSHFIPKLVYKMSYNSMHNFDGYLNHSLAAFKTSDFEPYKGPVNSSFRNVSICFYPQYRNPPNETDSKYEKQIVYWHVMAVRLGFIVVYQFFISLIVIAVEYAIPSIPQRMKNLMRNNVTFTLDMERKLYSREQSEYQDRTNSISVQRDV